MRGKKFKNKYFEMFLLFVFQVFQLTGHLVYWAKATVIYPLCEGNVYVVAPGANIHIHSPLVEEFAKEFPGVCLLQVWEKILRYKKQILSCKLTLTCLG